MKVLLAQFRKPATETRFYDRIAGSLAETGMEVIAAGTALKTSQTSLNAIIRIIPVFGNGNRLSTIFKNLGLLLDLLKKEKADILIFCNPEAALLLPVLKLMMPEMKTVFDLQENHGLNIRKQKHIYPMRRISSAAADLLVNLACRLADRVWLGEKIYESQLRIPPDRRICLPNKPSRLLMMKPASVDPELFSFTGFISRESGVLRAIGFVAGLRALNLHYRLQICGYCPEKVLIDEILSHSFVEYKNPGQWACQDTIISCLTTSCGMLMSYEETEANSGKIPSKWFLARAAGVPVLYNSVTCLQLPDQNEMGFAVDFENPEKFILSDWKKFRSNFKPLPFSTEHYFDDEMIRQEIFRLSGVSLSES